MKKVLTWIAVALTFICLAFFIRERKKNFESRLQGVVESKTYEEVIGKIDVLSEDIEKDIFHNNDITNIATKWLSGDEIKQELILRLAIKSEKFSRLMSTQFNVQLYNNNSETNRVLLVRWCIKTFNGNPNTMLLLKEAWRIGTALERQYIKDHLAEDGAFRNAFEKKLPE